MRIDQYLSFVILAILLVACVGMDGLSLPDTRIYQVQDIPNRQIHFIWLEVPTNLYPGSNEVRVFMARTDPPGMLVPTEVELPCIINAEEYLDLRPVTLPFEYDGRQLVGSYTWKACASCVECYMDWDTSMEIKATIEPDSMILSIGIRHMGHNIQDDYLQIKLWPEKPSLWEPRILCKRSLECEDIEYVRRLSQIYTETAK